MEMKCGIDWSVIRLKAKEVREKAKVFQALHSSSQFSLKYSQQYSL